MEKDLGKFFSFMFYGRLNSLTGIPIAIDDHAKAREVCSTVYWMKQSKMEFDFDFTELDFAYC